MSDENNSTGSSATDPRPRRGSFTQTTFSAIFGGRSNSVSAQPNTTGTGPFPTPINTANTGRRMSITTLGLSGTSPSQTNSFFPPNRRASISTAGSDSIEENAIEDDDGPARSVPTTPFTRRMSIGAQAMFNRQGGGGSPGATGRSSSYTHQPLNTIPDSASVEGQRPNHSRKQSSSTSQSQTQASKVSKTRTPSDFQSNRSAEGLNWSEQFRSRAESTVARPNLSTSPGSAIPRTGPTHERSKSVTEMPAPPQAMPSPPQKEVSAMRRKPDAIGERMLRGEFYMD